MRALYLSLGVATFLTAKIIEKWNYCDDNVSVIGNVLLCEEHKNCSVQ